MNKDDIKKELSEFLSAVENETAEINVLLVDQNNQRKKRYNGLMLKTTVEDIKQVVIDSFAYLSEEFDKRTLDIYDLEISVDDSAQMVKREDVIHGEEILSEIKVEYTEDTVVSKNTDLTKIKFIVIQVYIHDKSVYFFKRYIQPSSAYKTSQKYTLSGGVLKPFTEDIDALTSNRMIAAAIQEYQAGGKKGD